MFAYCGERTDVDDIPGTWGEIDCDKCLKFRPETSENNEYLIYGLDGNDNLFVVIDFKEQSGLDK